jgi:uncharacterized lipoprotein YbaY
MFKQYLQRMNAVAAIALTALMWTGAITSTMALDEGRVTGQVKLSQLRNLPPDAFMHVTLVDVTPREDVTTSIIARQTIANPNPKDMAFELNYDPTQIRSNHIYAIQVRIMSRGEIMYMNTSPYQVITKGHPHTANVIVSPRN